MQKIRREMHFHQVWGCIWDSCQFYFKTLCLIIVICSISGELWEKMEHF